MKNYEDCMISSPMSDGKEKCDLFDGAKELAHRLNQQPTVYTDENVFDYADDDDDDDGI